MKAIHTCYKDLNNPCRWSLKTEGLVRVYTAGHDLTCLGYKYIKVSLKALIHLHMLVCVYKVSALGTKTS